MRATANKEIRFSAHHEIVFIMLRNVSINKILLLIQVRAAGFVIKFLKEKH